jgi:hypothetical protein
MRISKSSMPSTMAVVAGRRGLQRSNVAAALTGDGALEEAAAMAGANLIRI